MRAPSFDHLSSCTALLSATLALAACGDGDDASVRDSSEECPPLAPGDIPRIR